MKWFFALCSESKDCTRTIEHLKVAVNSAKQNTNLQPYFLYDGEEDELTEWLSKNGVNVYITQVSFLDILKNHPKLESIGTARGAYLRVEVPRLMKQLKLDDKYVLYTDCDVIFTKKSEDIFNYTPEYFVAAPEFHETDYTYFNTGVMLMNIDNMYKTRKEFIKFIKDVLSKAKHFQPREGFTYDWYDQSMYNEFYKNKAERLDPIYNWKPYWGYSDKAKIIHFHGPKIDSIRIIENIELPDVLMHLYFTGQQKDKGYTKYKALFDEFNIHTK